MPKTSFPQQAMSEIDLSISEPLVSAGAFGLVMGLIGTGMVAYQWDQDKKTVVDSDSNDNQAGTV